MNSRNDWERGRGRLSGQGSFRHFDNVSPPRFHDQRPSTSHGHRTRNRGPQQRPYDQGPSRQNLDTAHNFRGNSRGHNLVDRGGRGIKRPHWETGFNHQEVDSLRERNYNNVNANQQNSSSTLDSQPRRYIIKRVHSYLSV